MPKNFKKYSGLIFALVSVVLLAIILLNPPTDFDGGPMLAYNFLFFYPMLSGAGILAIVSLIISVNRIARNKLLNRTLNSLSIILSTPALIFCALMVWRFLIIIGEPDPIERPDKIHNNSTSVTLHEKTIHLTGFNFGPEYRKRRVYISHIPYYNEEFRTQDAYFCQGDSDFELFYSSDKDSVFLYIPNTEPMYNYINSENLNQVPARAIQLTSKQIDSLKNFQSEQINRFTWNEFTEPDISDKQHD